MTKGHDPRVDPGPSRSRTWTTTRVRGSSESTFEEMRKILKDVMTTPSIAAPTIDKANAVFTEVIADRVGFSNDFHLAFELTALDAEGKPVSVRTPALDGWQLEPREGMLLEILPDVVLQVEKILMTRSIQQIVVWASSVSDNLTVEQLKKHWPDLTVRP